MIEYRIVIHYEGTKTYEISAECFEDAVEIARRGPEHITNEINDTVSESIMCIERVEMDK